MKRVFVRGLGAYVGDRVLSNTDLVHAGAAPTEDWILARTGIEERRIAPELTLTEMITPF